ncbi:MAG: hypothetical protein ISS48_01480 [Candidatus Aenigmarchaeota archaeon]|nr:hypothetical protein [Candidatus Aenigmarchaeota archaeon]
MTGKKNPLVELGQSVVSNGLVYMEVGKPTEYGYDWVVVREVAPGVLGMGRRFEYRDGSIDPFRYSEKPPLHTNVLDISLQLLTYGGGDSITLPARRRPYSLSELVDRAVNYSQEKQHPSVIRPPLEERDVLPETGPYQPPKSSFRGPIQIMAKNRQIKDIIGQEGESK